MSDRRTPTARTPKTPATKAETPAKVEETKPEPTTTEKETTVSVPTVEAPKKPRASVNFDVEFGAVEIVEEENPFSRGSYELDEKHPVYRLFVQSLEAGKPLSVAVDDPYSMVAVLRKVARQRANGVRISPETLAGIKDPSKYNGRVKFQAVKEKSNRGRKSKASGVATPGNPTTE